MCSTDAQCLQRAINPLALVHAVLALFLAMLGGCSTQPVEQSDPRPQPTLPTSTPPPSALTSPSSPVAASDAGGNRTAPPPALPKGQAIAELNPANPPIGTRLDATGFTALPGWRDDNLTAAWPAFEQSCQALGGRGVWRHICQDAKSVDRKSNSALRQFFERWFQPYRVNSANNDDPGLITGYYEPLVRGSRYRYGPYQYPLLKPPADLIQVDLSAAYPALKGQRVRGRLKGNRIVPYYTRSELEATGYSQHADSAVVWLDDPIEAFFLQVQGSGRALLPDGQILRVGYADQNGHPYRSIGRWLVEQGEMPLEKASMQSIKAWAALNPERLNELLNVNPSVVFFRELPTTLSEQGPVGSLGVPLTPGRSIAVDPAVIPLGLPVWLISENAEIPTRSAMQRLTLAQDTGGAIKGIVRADWFAGFGDEAGEKAGRMKNRGQLYVLLPKNQ